MSGKLMLQGRLRNLISLWESKKFLSVICSSICDDPIVNAKIHQTTKHLK
jgi:hypothetical protein